MKKFMLIFLSKSYDDQNLSPQEMQDRMGKWWAWQSKMEADGVVENGHALRPEKRRTIAGADRTVTDQTATELKEMIGGYYIVKADSYDIASEIAQGYPDYDLGGAVEIREVMVFEQ